MRDIDLIPADYVQARQTRHSVRVFAVLAALLLLTAAAAYGWIGLRLHAERKAFAEAQSLEGALGVQRTRLTALKALVDSGDARLEILRQLRDATVSGAWWSAVDEAYNDRLWLESVVYARTLRLGAAAPAAGAAPEPAASEPAKLTLAHTLELRGRARDHAAMTEFRRSLGEQPGVAAVKLTDSGLQQLGAQDIVTFTVTLALSDQRRRAEPAP